MSGDTAEPGPDPYCGREGCGKCKDPECSHWCHAEENADERNDGEAQQRLKEARP